MHTISYSLITIAFGLVFIIFRRQIVDSVFAGDKRMYGTFWKHFMFGGEDFQRKLNHWIFLAFGLLLVLAGTINLVGK